jgi:hypothetical protein
VNPQESSQLLSESLLDPDVFVRAAELIEAGNWAPFACVSINKAANYSDNRQHVDMFKALFGLTEPDGDGYTFAGPMFWPSASEEELQPIRVLALLFASHAARDHNRSVRARLAAQRRRQLASANRPT